MGLSAHRALRVRVDRRSSLGRWGQLALRAMQVWADGWSSSGWIPWPGMSHVQCHANSSMTDGLVRGEWRSRDCPAHRPIWVLGWMAQKGRPVHRAMRVRGDGWSGEGQMARPGLPRTLCRQGWGGWTVHIYVYTYKYIICVCI